MNRRKLVIRIFAFLMAGLMIIGVIAVAISSANACVPGSVPVAATGRQTSTMLPFIIGAGAVLLAAASLIAAKASKKKK